MNRKMTPDRINLVRGWVTWVVRGVAVILVVVGSYLMLKRLTLRLGNNFNFNPVFQTWDVVPAKASRCTAVWPWCSSACRWGGG